jgi:hypothetical protein
MPLNTTSFPKVTKQVYRVIVFSVCPLTTFEVADHITRNFL